MFPLPIVPQIPLINNLRTRDLILIPYTRTTNLVSTFTTLDNRQLFHETTKLSVSASLAIFIITILKIISSTPKLDFYTFRYSFLAAHRALNSSASFYTILQRICFLRRASGVVQKYFPSLSDIGLLFSADSFHRVLVFSRFFLVVKSFDVSVVSGKPLFRPFPACYCFFHKKLAVRIVDHHVFLPTGRFARPQMTQSCLPLNFVTV